MKKNHQDQLWSIKEHLLTYLAGSPSRLHQQGNSYAGQLALNLGNCLVWVCGDLDQGPYISQPVEENARSIHALGKQFQAAGRRLLDLDKPSGTFHQRFEDFERDLEALRTRAAILESERGTV